MTLLALFGGLALLLYGMQLIGEGLQRAAGGHLRHLLTRMTRTRLAGVASGALVTAIIQSSSATTLMLIGFVSAGLLTFPQSLGMILGADIGTTVTVQLLAFRVQELSLLLVGVGFALTFFSRRGLLKSLGQVVLGFGFIFLGMKVMNDGLAPLADNELTRQVLVALAGNQFLALLVGAGLSASMASSAATIGLTLSLGQQGLLPLGAAIPVVLGANSGACDTALAGSMRSSGDARRVAVAHIAFKVLGVALVFPFIVPLTHLVGLTSVDPARQIANPHTFFNVAISALFLPFAPWAARVITALVPEEERGDNPYRTRYLDDRFLEQPALAIGQATREALRMGDVSQGMLRDAMVVLRTANQELLEDVERRDSPLGRVGRGLAESLEASEIHLDVLTNLKRISSHVTALVYPILEEEA